MARMTKMTVKTTAPKKKADPGLTAAEQARLKKEWEMKNKKKLPAGSNLGVSSVENFRNRTGGYSITTTNQRRPAATKGSTGTKPMTKKP